MLDCTPVVGATAINSVSRNKNIDALVASDGVTKDQVVTCGRISTKMSGVEHHLCPIVRMHPLRLVNQNTTRVAIRVCFIFNRAEYVTQRTKYVES